MHLIPAVVLLAIVAPLLEPIEARATPVKCGTAIITGSAALFRARSSAIGKCRGKVVAGDLPPATDCALEPATAVTLAKARAKLDAVVAKACGGADKLCGTADDEDLTAAGWNAPVCPDVAGGACAHPIDDCGDVAACVACIGAASTGRTLATTYDAFALASPAGSRLEKCQIAIGKATVAFTSAKSAALARCWQAVRQGKATAPCPALGDGKAAGAIAKAGAKLAAVICKACGAGGDKKPADGACDVPGDAFEPQAEIGFIAICPGVRVPDGPDCGAFGAITTLDGLIDCLGCIAEFAVDCADRSAVGALADYPAACLAGTSTPTPTPTPSPTETASPTVTPSLPPVPTATPSPLADGEPCLSGTDCTHGFCVDGVCCENVCNGSCRSCGLPSAPGICTPAAAGTDPDGDCGAVACDQFYFGFVGDTCFRRADVAAGAASCAADGTCASAAALCPAQGQGTAATTCDIVCQDPNLATCSGQTPGTCVNVNPGNESCGQGSCLRSSAMCINGARQTCTPGTPSTETCNALDDDCNGTTDDGPFADVQEVPSDVCQTPRVLQQVGSDASVTLNALTLYPAADADHYRINAVETDNSCGCPGFSLDEDYDLTITLTVPAGAGSYTYCTDSVACGTQLCDTVAAGTSKSVTWHLDGACGPTATDSYSIYFSVTPGDVAPGFTCHPYTLTYFFDAGLCR